MTSRYIKYKSSSVIYHINFSGNITNKKRVNISTYVPPIMRELINSIDPKYNSNYIICPFYDKYYDYQLGITETSKINESFKDTIKRGINEESGISDISLENMYTLFKNINNKKWIGTILNEKYFKFNPNSIINNNIDNLNKKVAVILHNNLDSLLYTFQNIKKSDIKTDNIIGIGLISIVDCKNIINNYL